MIRKFMPFLGAFVLMAAMLDVSPVQGSEPGLTVLSNGLQVLIQPDTRFPLVSLRLYVRAGSAYETKDMSGISHFLEHMVFKGTAKRPPGKVAEDIESAGGYLNASTSFDYTVYVVDLPLEHWTLGLDVIRDMIFNAALDPEELEREKEVVLAELERGEDSPTSRLFKSTQALVWPDTAYGRPIIGYRETVRPFTREHILNYIAEFYQPQSMLLVVCGDVDPAEAVAQAGKYFGELENTRTLHPPRALTAPVQGMGPKVRVEHGPWNKAYLSLAFPLPGLHSEESAGLEVLGYLLGGDETSRLYRKFKYELELVDDISVYALSLEGAGMLYVHASLDRDKVDEFWQALNRELASLDAHDFTAKELDRTKLNIEDSLFQAKETLSGLAGKIGYFQFFERGREAEENYLYALSLVDKDQLQALIQKYLRLDSLCASLLLPEDPKDEASEDLNEKFLLKEVGEIWPAGSAGTKASADAKDSVKGPEIQDLGLGRTLVLLPDETLPYVSLNLVYGGGDSLLKPDEQGLAEMTAGALTKGTKDKSATQIQDFLSDRASFLSASAHRDLFTVSSKFPIRFEDDMLGLIQETLNSPAFAKQEVDRVRRDQTSDIKRSEDRPLGLAFRNLFPFLFQKSGYGYFHLGTPKDLERYDEGVVRAFWKRQKAKPWVMAVCGRFDRDKIMDLARNLAKEGAKKPSFTFQKPEWSKERVLDLTLSERNQAHLLVVFSVSGSRHEDAPGLDLLRTVLAGQGGILFRDLRDKQGLGYTVTAFLWRTPKTGFLAFYIGTYPDKVDEALAGFENTVLALREDLLSKEELARAKNLIRGEYHRDHQSLSSRSLEAAGLVVRGFELNHNVANLDKAAKLSPKDLRTLARKYLNWDDIRVLRVLP